MRTYRLLVMALLLVNFGFTLLLYRAYYTAVGLSYQNVLLLKNVLRHYDIVCSILDTYGPVSTFKATWYTSTFLQTYRILPFEDWYFGPVRNHANAFAESVQAGGLYSLYDWISKVSNLGELHGPDSILAFAPLRAAYDAVGKFVFGFFNFYVTPEWFFVTFALILFLIPAYVAFSFDRSAIVLDNYSKRLYRLELFVADKLNSGQALAFAPTSWTPSDSIRRTTPEPFFDPYLDYWLAQLSKQERYEREAAARGEI
jgi:hypothetical protein